MTEQVGGVWSDDELITRWRKAFDKPSTVTELGFVRWVRNDLRATIDAQAAQLDKIGGMLDLYKADADNLLARIAESEREIGRLALVEVDNQRLVNELATLRAELAAGGCRCDCPACKYCYGNDEPQEGAQP